MSSYEQANLALTGAAFVVSLIVLFFLRKQLSLLTTQVTDATAGANQERERSRKEATLQFIALTIEKQQELTNLVPLPGGPEYAAFLEKADIPESPEFKSLWNYLAYLEDLAVGMNLGVLDDEVVERSIGDRFNSGWSTNTAWITTQRQRYRRPRLFDELDIAAKRLRDLRTALYGPSVGDQATGLNVEPTAHNAIE